MTDADRQTLGAMAARIETLSETAERAIAIATDCATQARAWQEAHEQRSDRLLEMTDEIRALVDAMRWTSTARHVVLWLAGALVSVSAAYHWLAHFFSGRPSGG